MLWATDCINDVLIHLWNYGTSHGNDFILEDRWVTLITAACSFSNFCQRANLAIMNNMKWSVTWTISKDICVWLTLNWPQPVSMGAIWNLFVTEFVKFDFVFQFDHNVVRDAEVVVLCMSCEFRAGYDYYRILMKCQKYWICTVTV